MYFPQSSTRRSQALQTNRKAFLFYPFSRERTSYLINMHVSQEVGRLSDSPLCWLSETESGSKVRAKCGHMFFCCLRQSWVGGAVDWISPSCTPHQYGALTYAGMYCLEFYQQCEYRQDRWRPPASGSTQNNDRLLHMSDSTCIQTRDILRHISGKSI